MSIALLIVASVLAVEVGAEGLVGAAATEEKPNVVVVTIDTLRADRLGSYGYPLAQTPALDKLAGESVRFENAYSAVPLTLPAHCSLFTGTYPLHHGVRDNSGYVLPDDRTTMAEVLRRESYRTGAFVGAFVLDSKFGLDQGFERYFDDFDLTRFENVSPGYIQRRGEEVVKEALSWVSGQSRPFFLWVHLYDPHDPYTPPEPFASAHPGRPYDGEVAYADHAVGMLLDGLRVKGAYNDSLIVVVGDHGESLGEHQEKKHGLFVYNATLRVPLLMRLPQGDRAGRVVTDPVSIVDLMPTILQLVEIDRDRASETQGRRLASVVLAKGQTARTGLYAESYYSQNQFGWSPLQAVIDDRYKFIEAPQPELYDLAHDPDEKTNLAGENAALVSRFRLQLENLEKRYATAASDAAAGGVTDSDTLRKLQSLGYVAQSPAGQAPSDRQPIDPKDRIGFYNRILDLFELSAAGRYQEAIPGYLEALETQPSLRIVWYKLAQAYFFTGRFEQALEKFKRAVELGGDDALATFDLAQTYMRLGKFEEAIPGFERTLQLDPSHYRARINLGVLYRNKGRLEAAIAQFEKALEIAPRSTLALGNLGVSYSLAGRSDEAVDALRRALELDPQDARLHANLAAVYQRMGRVDEARRSMEEARRLNPDLFRNRPPRQ